MNSHMLAGVYRCRLRHTHTHSHALEYTDIPRRRLLTIVRARARSCTTLTHTHMSICRRWCELVRAVQVKDEESSMVRGSLARAERKVGQRIKAKFKASAHPDERNFLSASDTSQPSSDRHRSSVTAANKSFLNQTAASACVCVLCVVCACFVQRSLALNATCSSCGEKWISDARLQCAVSGRPVIKQIDATGIICEL